MHGYYLRVSKAMAPRGSKPPGPLAELARCRGTVLESVARGLAAGSHENYQHVSTAALLRDAIVAALADPDLTIREGLG
jgi:hypothetical protein